MTIPQQPPDNELPDPKDPETDIPSEEPMPGETPEYPASQEPEWRAPGADDQPDAPIRAPGE